MISKNMKELVKGSSAIRAMFEEGKKMAEIYGAKNVYDFSLGNPNMPPPPEVTEELTDILKWEKPTFIHSYMNNAGYEDVRETIAKAVNKKFNTQFEGKNIIMTVGAAGGLNVVLKTLLDPGDEVVVFAPYFGEYRVYVSTFGGNLVVVPPHIPGFQPDLKAFEKAVTARTKAVIVNSPNNPTGVVYSEDTIIKMAEILNNAQNMFKTDIYLISDEPYRELVYDGAVVPYIPKYYDNTIVGYSYSKSLSLPGERIGYIVIPDEIAGFEELSDGLTTANRILGYVNAPSLMQRAVARCENLDIKTDMTGYNKNREALYHGLLAAGYDCVKPQGAFYLFVKSPIENDAEFCEAAKKYNILIVPGAAFACPGYVRIAYCVAYETIVAALPKFKELIDEVNS